MRFFHSGWRISLAVLALGFTPVHAGDPIEEAITYRQSAYKMIVWHVKPMTAMVKGKRTGTLTRSITMQRRWPNSAGSRSMALSPAVTLATPGRKKRSGKTGMISRRR